MSSSVHYMKVSPPRIAQRSQNTCVLHRHSYRAQLKCLPAQHNTSTLCHINHCLHFTFPLSSWRRVPTLQCTSFSIFLRMEPTATIKVTMTTNDLTRYWPPEAAGLFPALTQNETVYAALCLAKQVNSCEGLA